MNNITFESYNSSWPAKFSEERKLIMLTLPLPVTVHHVGSTAVPDLLSKPIIDIGLECKEYPPNPFLVERLTAIGYSCQGESGVPGRVWFTKGNPRQFNLHFCALNSEIIRRQLKFRDALINQETLRREYERIKLKNSKNRHIDDPDYAAAKTAFVLQHST